MIKNKNNFECPVCNEVVFSEIGKGCKMCGMPLKNKDDEFCTNACRIKYTKINLITT